MRLSLVISSLSAGGAERVMCTLAGAWAARGHEVTLLTTHDGGRPPHYRLEPGVALRSVDPRRRGVLKQASLVRNLHAALRETAPDVAVSFLNYTNIITLMASRTLKVPVVVSERLDPRVIRIGAVWSLLRRITYRRAAILVAQTQTAAGLFEPLARGRVRVIPNPVPQPPAGTEATPYRSPTILAVGRLHRQKGFDVALRALAALDTRYSDWQLVILGEGDARGELEMLRDRLGLGERVQLPGTVADPWPWYRGAAMFLLSSRSEGFPNVLCEAMACGLPVVATDCPSGPAEIIAEGTNGLLIPVDDPQAMAAALERLMADEKERARLGAAATEVADRYALANVLAEWDRLLGEITTAAGGRCR